MFNVKKMQESKVDKCKRNAYQEITNRTYHWSCMKEIGCYSDAQRQDIDNSNYWACHACKPLSKDEKLKRKSNSFSNELMRVDWEPSWDPEDIRGAWLNFHECILDFEACKDEPDLSTPAADSELDDLKGKDLKILTRQTLGNKN